jgi:hypothetical protein
MRKSALDGLTENGGSAGLAAWLRFQKEATTKWNLCPRK